MNDSDEIFGCFVSTTTDAELDEKNRNIALEKGRIFRGYIWGEHGICEILRKLKYQTYGKDLKIILFQFYVNPNSYLKENLKKIEDYRKKEKSIGIPIIVTDENFFNKSDIGRYKFLKETILSKMHILSETIKIKHLDTNSDLLKLDLEKILNK